MAIDSALEASVPLLIVNLIRLPPYPTTLDTCRAPSTPRCPHEEDLEAVRATADRAAELGVKTELLRVRTKRPVQALLQVASERDAGLIVFGPHLGRVGRMRFRRAAKRIRREAILSGVGGARRLVQKRAGVAARRTGRGPATDIHEHVNLAADHVGFQTDTRSSPVPRRRS